jgi:hypothetical protein
MPGKMELRVPEATAKPKPRKKSCCGCFCRSKKNKTMPVLVKVSSKDGNNMRRAPSRKMSVDDLRTMSIRAKADLDEIQAALAEHDDPAAMSPRSRKRHFAKGPETIPLNQATTVQLLNIFQVPFACSN